MNVVATIESNDGEGRVALCLAQDGDGFYIESDTGEDTGGRWPTAEAALESLERWSAPEWQMMRTDD
jgi:hypothetical protein